MEQASLNIVLEHMMTDADAAVLFGRYDLPRISDIDGKLYQALGRKPATFMPGGSSSRSNR